MDHTGADLSGARLSDLDLRGKVFRNACLRGADLTACNLIGVDLEGADLSAAWLTGARLNRANLRAANLTRACVIGTDFRDAQIDAAVLDEVVYDQATTWPPDAPGPESMRETEPATASSSASGPAVSDSCASPVEPRPQRRSPVRQLPSGIPLGLAGRIVEGRRAGFFIQVDDDTERPRPRGTGGWHVVYWDADTAHDDWFLNAGDVPAAFADITVEWSTENGITDVDGAPPRRRSRPGRTGTPAQR